MSALLSDLGRGFADPVLAAQQVFRTLLQALSYAGRPLLLDEAALRGMERPTRQLEPAAAALLLALLDDGASLHLHGRLRSDAVSAWLRFHTGVRMAQAHREADFHLVACGDIGELCPLPALELGSDEAPQRGATAIVQVGGFDDPAAAGTTLTLRGPGIADVQRLRVNGLPAAFWRERIALQPLYPRGLDLVLVAGRRLCALPRSTHIRLDD